MYPQFHVCHMASIYVPSSPINTSPCTTHYIHIRSHNYHSTRNGLHYAKKYTHNHIILQATSYKYMYTTLLKKLHFELLIIVLRRPLYYMYFLIRPFNVCRVLIYGEYTVRHRKMFWHFHCWLIILLRVHTYIHVLLFYPLFQLDVCLCR